MIDEQLTVEDMRGTRALMQAADYMIGFERIVAPEVEEKPCTIYRSYIDADGKPQMVEIGKCFVGKIEDCEEPEPPKQQNRVWMAIDFPDFRTGELGKF